MREKGRRRKYESQAFHIKGFAEIVRFFLIDFSILEGNRLHLKRTTVVQNERKPNEIFL